MPSLIGRCGGGGSTGAWAIVWRDTTQGDAGLVVGSGVPVDVPFLHFETTDQTVFATSPGGVAGDTLLRCAKAGIYTFELGGSWAAAFAQNTYMFVNVQTFHGPGWAHRANFLPYAAPGGPFPLFQMFDARVYPFTSADLGGGPAVVEVSTEQLSGGNQTLKQMWMRVAYVPTGATETVVY